MVVADKLVVQAHRLACGVVGPGRAVDRAVDKAVVVVGEGSKVAVAAAGRLIVADSLAGGEGIVIEAEGKMEPYKPVRKERGLTKLVVDGLATPRR